MSGSVHNESSGEPDTVVQARDIGTVQVNAAPLRLPDPPRQLPPPHPKYTNRSRELREIGEAVLRAERQDRGGRLLLTGPERIGKSALLAELMNDHKDAFPDGVLHVELSGYRDREGNTEYTAALHAVLRDLHVAGEERPSRLPELRARLRQVTSGRRVLLALDDVADSEEIDIFEPGGGPHLLVAACRADFSGLAAQISQGADVLPLERLDEPDSVALLGAFPHVERRMRVPEEREAARHLVGVCGGLPPVLRMAAAHLTARPELTITGLVAAVRARHLAEPGTSPVDAVVALALGALTPEQLELLRRLAAHPGRFFPAELGTVVMGNGAPDLLRQLTEASVLRPAGAEGYDIIELVRAEARRRRADLPPDRRRADDEAVLRFFTVTHAFADAYTYGERSRLADTLGESQFTVAPADYRPPFGSPPEAADWQDQNIGHTSGLMRLAVDLDHPEAALLLADATWPTYHGRHRLAVGTSVYGYAARVARARRQYAGLARVLCYLARLHIELGRWDAAERNLAEAETAAVSSGDSLNRAVVLETLGLLRQRAAQPDQEAALRLLSEARSIHRERGRPRGNALQTYQIGNLCRDMGDTGRSLAELTEAEAIATRRLAELGEQGARSGWSGGSVPHATHDWELLRARIRLALARTHLEREEWERAAHAASLAQRLFAEARQPVKEAQALRVLVTLAERRGDTTTHRELLTRVHRIYTHFHMAEAANEALGRFPERG